MTDHSGNIAFDWATTFLKTLSELGTKHIIISPGSRSTPLTLAAAVNDSFEKKVILDERSAAFTALGIGKATNIPAVLICTSGTAVANYYPAVIEARESGVPLILATADRPPHLRATGANQAIDQIKIFGDYPVFFHETGEPSTEMKDLKRLKRLGRQAFSVSREQRGPVHLNFCFRKPLEPESKVLLNAKKEKKNTFSPDKSTNKFSTAYYLSDDLQAILEEARKPLMILGPLAPGDDIISIAHLAETIGCPVLAESAIHTSNTIEGFAGFLRNKSIRDELEPDLILRFGFQPTSKSLELGLQTWEADNHLHFASTEGWEDATFSGADHLRWLGRPIQFGPFSSSPDKEWLARWKKVEQEFKSYSTEITTTSPSLTDGSVYYHFTPHLSSNHFIAVANSFPARDINLFGRQDPDIPIFLNRGASGIDGLTSTAMGISLSLQQAGVLFTGDLAFLHDTNALLNHKKLENSLTIVVINNDGGSIFACYPFKNTKSILDLILKRLNL
jgi:2-succinyl-5-enolpyruvyl-6-hydroxy-3-cyclohexene-1-carboxylate synthase